MTTIVDLTTAPKRKRPAGEAACCEPLFRPQIDVERAERIGRIAKALGDPVRVQLVDVLRQHAGQVCVCELEPLFDIARTTLSHHLRKLLDAQVLGVERKGLWAFYYVKPEAMEDLNAWLS